MISVPRPLIHRIHQAFGHRVETWIKRISPVEEPDSLQAQWPLSPEEQVQMMAIPFHEDRVHYTAGRTLVRHILGHRLGIAPHLVPIVADAQGRPHLDCTQPVRDRPSSNPGTYDFNLSHSGDYLALVVTTGLRVGIDIELLLRYNASIDLARRFFADREYKMLVRAGHYDYLQRWYRIWTTREAYAKARGDGVLSIGTSLAGHGTEWTSLSVPTTNQYVCSVVALSPTTRRG